MMTVDRVWDGLLTIALQSALICLVAGVGLLLLRKAAAAARHLLLTLTLGALLAAPVLFLCVPPLHLRWELPGKWQQAPAPQSAAPVFAPPTSGAEEGDAPSRNEVALPSRPSNTPAPLSPVLTPAPVLTSAPAAEEVRPYRVPYLQTRSAKAAFLAIWLLGAGIALLRLAAGLIGTWRVTTRETFPDPELARMVAEVQRELGIRSPVAVRQLAAGSQLPAPLTWGVVRPTLLLPAHFREWSPERRRMVVLHELAHVRRGDCLVQTLIQITRALYWFHPLVWWATARLQAECERACDDTVLLTGVTPAAYAETLLEVIRTMHRSKSKLSPLSMLGMAHPPIEARLRAILSARNRRRPSRTVALVAAAGTALCTLGLASLQIGAHSQIVPPQPITQLRPDREEQADAAQAQADREREDARRRLAQDEEALEKARARGNAAKDDSAALRRKLEALEELLVRNQQENAELRRRLKALESQRGAGKKSRGADAQWEAQVRAAQADLEKAAITLKAQANKQRAELPRAKEQEALNAQRMAMQAMVKDLQAQQEVLQNRQKQAEELYRAGVGSVQDTNRVKAERDVALLQLQSAQKQLRALEAGHKISEKEQANARLQLRLAQVQANLEQAEATLAIVKARHDAGLATAAEVSEAQARISALKVELDQIKLQYTPRP